MVDSDALNASEDSQPTISPENEVRSTKHPLPQSSKQFKRSKKGSKEYDLLNKAITCIKSVASSTEDGLPDEYDLFGKYILQQS